MRQLVDRSERIVLGRVVDERARWDDRGRIITDVDFEVQRSMKGGAASSEVVTLRCLGGTIGDLGMRVVGEPEFAPGERALLFMRRAGGHLRPIGMSQGAMPVRTEQGQEMVYPGGSDLALMPPKGSGLSAASTALDRDPKPLSEVLREIEAQLQHGDDGTAP